MNAFEIFSLVDPVQIVGGRLFVTTCGRVVCDYYDDESDRIIYAE
jgi:hypothetical protein